MALMPKSVAGAVMYVGLATAASANCVDYISDEGAAKAPRSIFCGPNGCEEIAIDAYCVNAHTIIRGYTNGFVYQCDLGEPSNSSDPEARCSSSLNGRKLFKNELMKYSCYAAHKMDFNEGEQCAGVPSPCTRYMKRIELGFNEQDIDTRYYVQYVLKNAGYYYGPIDGKWGRQTAYAVDSFCMHEYQSLQLSDQPRLLAGDADRFWMTISDYGEMISDGGSNQDN